MVGLLYNLFCAEDADNAKATADRTDKVKVA
jgi:hypothetical protein